MGQATGVVCDGAVGHYGLVSKWLNGLVAWQFALLYTCCMVMAMVIGASITQVTTGHLDFSFIVGYGIIFTLVSTGAATWTRQRRRRHTARSDTPRTWFWN